ncbi:unnamed protein product [Arabidopsis halleri]
MFNNSRSKPKFPEILVRLQIHAKVLIRRCDCKVMKNNSIENNLGENEDPIYPMKTRKQPIRSKCSFCLNTKFVAGYRRRDVEATKRNIQKEALEVIDQCPLMDHIKCFETVAAGVKDSVSDAVVDLKSPEVVYI